MGYRLAIMLVFSLALHGWLLWSVPAPTLPAPGGAVALKLGQLRLATSAPQVAPVAKNRAPEAVSNSMPEPALQVDIEAVLAAKVEKTVPEADKTPLPETAQVNSLPENANLAVQDFQAQQSVASSNSSQLSVSEDPVLVEQPAFASPPGPPQYPTLAMQRRQQGTAIVEVELDVSGKQQVRRLLRSSGVSSLDAAALEAVESWSFLPYKNNGQPRRSIVRLPIRFKL